MTEPLPCAKHGIKPIWHSRTERWMCQECVQEAWVKRRARQKIEERNRAAEKWNAEQRAGTPEGGTPE